MRALALLALASGCSRAEPPPGPSGRPVASLSEVAGAWSIVRFEDYEPVRLGLGGQPQAYVVVRDGSLGFMLGCNSSGAEARLSRDGTLSASGDGIQTLSTLR